MLTRPRYMEMLCDSIAWARVVVSSSDEGWSTRSGSQGHADEEAIIMGGDSRRATEDLGENSPKRHSHWSKAPSVAVFSHPSQARLPLSTALSRRAAR